MAQIPVLYRPPYTRVPSDAVIRVKDDEFVRPNLICDQIELPTSTSCSPFKPSTGVTVTRDKILVRKQIILKLEQDGLPQAYFDDGKTPELMAHLETDFTDVTPAQERDPDVEAIVLVQADKDLDYRSIWCFAPRPLSDSQNIAWRP